MALAAQEAIWLILILSELSILDGVHCRLPVCILTDNQGAQSLSKNAEYHARTKHIDIRYHFLRQEVLAGKLEYMHVSTNEQAADGLTKPLAKNGFTQFVKQLGMVDLPEAITPS
jgi:hypothetical protein